MVKVEEKKMRKGDRLLIWARVEDVYVPEKDGDNNVKVSFEKHYDNASEVRLDLTDCDVEKYEYKSDLMEKVFKFLTKGLRLNKREKAMLKETLDK